MNSKIQSRINSISHACTISINSDAIIFSRVNHQGKKYNEILFFKNNFKKVHPPIHY